LELRKIDPCIDSRPEICVPFQRHHEEKVTHVKSTSKTNARKQLDNSVPSTSGLLLADHKKLMRETSGSLFSRVSPFSLRRGSRTEPGFDRTSIPFPSELFSRQDAEEAYVLRADL
jgi:hypothetical protein